MVGSRRDSADSALERTAHHWSQTGNHVRVVRHDMPVGAIGQHLFSVWHRLRDRAGGVPPWIDLEALGVPEAIPGAILALPEQGSAGRPPERFIAAYVGDEVQRVWGEDFTGQVMYSDVFPEIYAAIADGMRDALHFRLPVAAEYRVQIAFRISYLYGLFLPFQGAMADQSRVLVHLNFSNITVGGAQDWRTTLETQERIQRLLEERPPEN